MQLLFFVGFISSLTILFGLLLNLLMGIPISILMTYKETYINIIIVNIITRLILTSIVALAVLKFIHDRNYLNPTLYYIIGFYSFMVMFTLIDAENANTAKSENDYTMQEAFNFNRYLIVIALFYFVFAINFPIILNFYIPSLSLSFFNWVLDFKLFYWIVNLAGFGATIYILKYTFMFILSILGMVWNKIK